MNNLREKIAKIILDYGTARENGRVGQSCYLAADAILSLASGVETVRKCENKKEAYYYHVYCKDCNGKAEIASDLTVQEIIEWAAYVINTMDEEGHDYTSYFDDERSYYYPSGERMRLKK